MWKCVFEEYGDNEGPNQPAQPQSHQGFHCLLTESLDTVEYTDAKQFFLMSLNCVALLADQDLFWLHTTWRHIFHGTALILQYTHLVKKKKEERKKSYIKKKNVLIKQTVQTRNF